MDISHLKRKNQYLFEPVEAELVLPSLIMADVGQNKILYILN